MTRDYVLDQGFAGERSRLSGMESLWDPGGHSHPTITSVREHKGYLYIGGLENNRIGRIPLPDADPTWEAHTSYWGGR